MTPHHLPRRWIASLLCTLAAACNRASPPAPESGGKSASRLDPAAARDHVRGAILARTPQAALGPDDPPLRDVTTPEVWERLQAQVFRTLGEHPFGERTFFVRGGESIEIGDSFGGLGVLSFCVADLDRDGGDELAFTCAFGSGTHRSEARAVVSEAGKLRELKASPAFFEGDGGGRLDLMTRAGSRGEALVELGAPREVPNAWDHGRSAGRLRLSGTGAERTLLLELDPVLPAELRARFR